MKKKYKVLLVLIIIGIGTITTYKIQQKNKTNNKDVEQMVKNSTIKETTDKEKISDEKIVDKQISDKQIETIVGKWKDKETKETIELSFKNKEIYMNKTKLEIVKVSDKYLETIDNKEGITYIFPLTSENGYLAIAVMNQEAPLKPLELIK